MPPIQPMPDQCRARYGPFGVSIILERHGPRENLALTPSPASRCAGRQLRAVADGRATSALRPSALRRPAGKARSFLQTCRYAATGSPTSPKPNPRSRGKAAERSASASYRNRQLERHPHGRALLQFAQIADMDFGGEEGMLALLQITLPQPCKIVEFVEAAIEQHIVIGHVQVAVEINPGRLDGHHRRDEGSKENRFEICAIEHA